MHIESFELIELPFEVREGDGLFPLKYGDLYVVEIADGAHTKKIPSRLLRARKYLHIVADAENAMVCGASSDCYAFDVPADFYLPTAGEVVETYREVQSGISNGSLKDLFVYARRFLEKFREDRRSFPPYPMPIITKVGLCNDKKFKELLVERKKEKNAIVVRYGERTPETPRESAVRLAKHRSFGDCDPIGFLENAFAEHPIIRMGYIRKFYEENMEERHKHVLSFNKFRSLVPAVAYFMNSDPWYKTWIRFGTDPAADPEMYRYQVVGDSARCTGTQLFENPEIISLVKKNTDTFTSSKCHHKYGFLTPYGIAHIKKLMRGSRSGGARHDEEAHPEFEVFD